jgi:hypothetical protein
VVEVGRRGDGGARWGGEVTVVQPRPWAAGGGRGGGAEAGEEEAEEDT